MEYETGCYLSRVPDSRDVHLCAIRGGPLVLPDHPALVEEVLTKLGYLADGDLTEAVLAFCNRSANKSN